MIPITRKELYLNKIVGNDDYSVPEKPITKEEFFFAEILGEAVQAPEPLTRYQMYLAKIAGHNIEIPYPKVRLEYFLAKAAGMEIETPAPITIEEIFWSNYSVIVDFEVEGILPLTYKAVKGTLKNYRIYGNTVDGESAGDKTGNLFNYKTMAGISGNRLDSNGNEITDTQWAISGFIPCTGNAFTIGKVGGGIPAICLYDENQNFITGKAYNTGSATIKRSITITAEETAKFVRFSYFVIESNPDAYDDLTTKMLNVGTEALPYEPYGYKVPVTVSNGADTQIVPIYLTEQIKKVGDDAEYIDYGEQKQHRVRKNLLKITCAASGATTYDGVSISNNDGILTLNGTSINGSFINLATAIKLPIGNYILTGGSENSILRFQKTSLGYGYDDTGAGRNFICPEEVTSGVCMLKLTANYTYNSVKVYPMIRKADIEDDTYEPYIADTELDVTLPALPTLSGTNTLSVGTEVQPSNVYIKYGGAR